MVYRFIRIKEVINSSDNADKYKVLADYAEFEFKPIKRIFNDYLEHDAAVFHAATADDDAKTFVIDREKMYYRFTIGNVVISAHVDGLASEARELYDDSIE